MRPAATGYLRHSLSALLLLASPCSYALQSAGTKHP